MQVCSYKMEQQIECSRELTSLAPWIFENKLPPQSGPYLLLKMGGRGVVGKVLLQYCGESTEV